MILSNKVISEILEALLRRTQSYFDDEIGFPVVHIKQERGEIGVLELRDLTAIVGLGGAINLLIAFSFETRLVQIIYERMTRDIDIPPDEEKLYQSEAIAELVNTIVGNCTADIREPSQRVSLSPPIIIQDGRQIQRTRKSMFKTLCIESDYGRADVNLIWPVDLFDHTLNYRE